MTLHRDVLDVLEQVEVVSLDVFDTSIHRAVLDPVDLFALVPERLPELAAAMNGFPAGWRYRDLRHRAEAKARRLLFHGEVVTAGIVAQLGKDLKDKDLAARAMEVELDLELDLVRPSEPGVELAAEALRLGKRLVYASDMYLPSELILNLLIKAGLPAAPVFVSNEHLVSKTSGGLFDVVLRWAGCRPDQVVHVGDDPGADHAGARRAGLRTIELTKPSSLYRRPRERFPVPHGLGPSDSMNLGLAAPAMIREVAPLRADQPASRLEAVGQSVLGPAVVSFTSWIIGRTSNEPPLLFCSRDSLLLRECYERLGPARGRTAPSHYFHVSRRSVLVPALAAGISDRHIDFLVAGRRPLSAAAMFTRVGLDRSIAVTAARRAGVDDVDTPIPATARGPVAAMFRLASDALVEVARRELDELGRYWAALGLDGVDQVVMIDVGWRATVQRCLQEALGHLGQPTMVRGLYLGLFDHLPLEVGSAEGMLVHDGFPWQQRVAVETGLPVIEMMFQADHGSVVNYSEGRPVLEPGGIGRSIVDPIQAGARRHLEEVASLGMAMEPTGFSMRPLLRLLNQPRPIEASDLGGFEHSDGLADDVNSARMLPSVVNRRELVPTASGRARLRGVEWRPGMVALAGGSELQRLAGSHLLTNVKLAKLAAAGAVPRARRLGGLLRRLR